MINFKNTNKWAKTFYILAIIAAVCFIYILYSSIAYMASTAQQYGAGLMTVYGIQGILQTVVGSVFPFLVYVALLFGMGLVLNKVLGDKQPKEKKPEIDEAMDIVGEEVPALEESTDNLEEMEESVEEEIPAIEEEPASAAEEETLETKDQEIEKSEEK